MIIENENSLVIKNSINVCITPYTLDINYWMYVFSNKEERLRLIKLGESQAAKFINNYQNNYDSSYNTININNDISFNLNDIRFENIILQPPKL